MSSSKRSSASRETLLRGMLERVPDMSLLKQSGSGCHRAAACHGADHVFVYLPTGRKVTVHMGRIAGRKVTAAWFDPRSGDSTDIGLFDNTGQQTFTPPSQGRGNDWILILDSI